MIPDVGCSRRDHGSDVRFLVGAGDGNRTRTISLGICPVTAARALDLGIRVPASDRGYPSFTETNGTLMARRSCRVRGDPSSSGSVRELA